MVNIVKEFKIQGVNVVETCQFLHTQLIGVFLYHIFRIYFGEKRWKFVNESSEISLLQNQSSVRLESFVFSNDVIVDCARMAKVVHRAPMFIK